MLHTHLIGQLLHDKLRTHVRVYLDLEAYLRHKGTVIRKQAAKVEARALLDANLLSTNKCSTVLNQLIKL